MEQMLSGLGGKSDWVSRLGARVLPSGVSVVDDPGAKDFNGTPLIGGYTVDNEVCAIRSHSGGERQPEERADVRRPGRTPTSPTDTAAAFLNDASDDEQSVLFLGGNTFRGRDEEEISGQRAARKSWPIVWSCAKWTIPR